MERLCRFNHHPDPVIDFEIEVEEIQGEVWNWRHGVQTIGNTADLLRRAGNALDFKFVPGGECQRAMELLRATVYPIEDQLLAAANT
jgi:hypothetical protein